MTFCQYFFDLLFKQLFIVEQSQTERFHQNFGISAGIPKLAENAFCRGTVYLSASVKLGGFGQLDRCYRNIRVCIKHTETLSEEEICRNFGISRESGGLFKEICNIGTGGKQLCIVFGQRVFGDIVLLAFIGKCRHSAADGIQRIRFENERCKIAIGEISVIGGAFLKTHRDSLPCVLVKAQGLLLYFFSFFKKRCLPFSLIFDRTFYGIKRVEVFGLGAGAKAGRADFTHREIYIASKLTFVHAAIGNTGKTKNGAKLFQKGNSFGRGAKIRFGDNFNKRDAAAVVVDKSAVLIGVKQLTCIFFNVNACYANALFAAFGFNIKITVLAKGQIKLCYLITFGKIGIHIVFAVKCRDRVYLAVEGKSCFYGTFHGIAVELGKSTGKPKT